MLQNPVKVLAGQVATATGQSGALYADSAPRLDVQIDVTAVSGTTPSATFSVQWSEDGANFAAPNAADSLNAITAVGNTIGQFQVKAPWYRVVWTISGTTPSFTFDVWASAN